MSKFFKFIMMLVLMTQIGCFARKQPVQAPVQNDSATQIIRHLVSSENMVDDPEYLLDKILLRSEYEVIDIGWEKRNGVIHMPHKALIKISDERFFFEDQKENEVRNPDVPYSVEELGIVTQARKA